MLLVDAFAYIYYSRYAVTVVFEDSSWTIVDPPFGVNSNSGGMRRSCILDYTSIIALLGTLTICELTAVQTTVAAHDTTGGMSTKIAEAASIAAMGIDVYIVEVIIHYTLLSC